MKASVCLRWYTSVLTLGPAPSATSLCLVTFGQWPSPRTRSSLKVVGFPALFCFWFVGGGPGLGVVCAQSCSAPYPIVPNLRTNTKNANAPGLSLDTSHVQVLGCFWLQYLGAHSHSLPLLQCDRVCAARAPLAGLRIEVFG